MRGRMKTLLLVFLSLASLRFGAAITNQGDANALRSLMNSWSNPPPSWGSSDPCDTPWEGVACTGGRVTQLTLSSMGIKGTLSDGIGQLTALTYLDLSSNGDLGGELPGAAIGKLTQLTTLVLQGCGFTGSIPDQLGSLTALTYLALNSNKFSGSIPASLGRLLNLNWFDLSDNQLTGPIPVSAVNGTYGLDQLVNCQHFHFNKNQLSGAINAALFNSSMKLVHILFDHNNLIGSIPISVSNVSTLQILRLDNNQLMGSIPTQISTLTNLQELRLSNNSLGGSIPDLSPLIKLFYLDLGNNTKINGLLPTWLSNLTSLTTLNMDSLGLIGSVPKQLFTLPQIQQVILSNNKLSDTLDMSGTLGPQLQLVNLQNNGITSANVNPAHTYTLMLAGNPACNVLDMPYCNRQQRPSLPYSTPLTNCASTSCTSDQSVSPLTCACAYPYSGRLEFHAPLFSDLTNAPLFQGLEINLTQSTGVPLRSVVLSQIVLTSFNYLIMTVEFFPSSGMYFNRADANRISTILSNQSFKPPPIFGPYSFTAYSYNPGGSSPSKGTTLSPVVVVAIAIGGIVLLVCLAVLAVYARRQRLRAQEAIDQISRNPFASWGVGPNKGGSIPHLSGIKFITFEELKRCTNSFADSHEIGAGGYGKVYKGVLPDGEVVAIKRAQAGSMQGGAEFKNEIELLSRVHHRNLVRLVGFCYEQGEQMLVYEYISHGTLRDNLIGKYGMRLSWKQRLVIAYDSARGLAYLHELADPPIIHRDIKSTNILLDEHLTAKVSDFGLSKLVSDTEKGHVSTQVKGTLGYLDPEYYMTQQLSEKSDVYSFGVVMLELVSARLPIEKGKYIVREVRAAIDQQDPEFFGLKDILDPYIYESAKTVGFRRFVQLAMECVDESAASRPTMNEVVREIEIILQNEGVGTGHFGGSSEYRNTAGKHPYEAPLNPGSSTGMSTGTFEVSGGYTSYMRVEPK